MFIGGGVQNYWLQRKNTQCFKGEDNLKTIRSCVAGSKLCSLQFLSSRIQNRFDAA